MVPLLAGTAIYNPVLNMLTIKQVVRGSEKEPMSYAKILSQNHLRTFTLGYTAAVMRNFFLAFAFIPSIVGSDMQSMQALFGMGALLLSHPFEVARVLIVDGEKNHITGRTMATLQSLYKVEGIAGLYKGFVPRTI